MTNDPDWQQKVFRCRHLVQKRGSGDDTKIDSTSQVCRFLSQSCSYCPDHRHSSHQTALPLPIHQPEEHRSSISTVLLPRKHAFCIPKPSLHLSHLSLTIYLPTLHFLQSRSNTPPLFLHRGLKATVEFNSHHEQNKCKSLLANCLLKLSNKLWLYVSQLYCPPGCYHLTLDCSTHRPPSINVP